ncbi:MAG TPA: hypothetical protein VJI32_04170 [Candidatus Nanoarchaeia archaeon]|nr:hypothetical protein [Candidatus Nanoarchaeia archaeon]
MVKLSIVVAGSYTPNTNYSPFDSQFAEDEDERITLPGLVMLPEEPRISYIPHSIPYISLDYLPAEEESLYF